ncbi:MAG: arabinofuranosidase catalytic domain-containing protein [Flavobacteriales bacterium]
MKYLFLLILLVSSAGYGQIAHYNQFPTMQHMRNDSILDSISFAFSMRQLYDDYQGPIIRLRRASDNAEMDFCAASDTIVDIDSINNWRAGSNVFVTVWYDQSGMCRNAIQPTVAFQPRFFPNANRPYFVGDGTNDKLDVLTDIKVLTNNGANGTVFSVVYSTSKQQVSWGSSGAGGDRWFTHFNWTNGRAYFDPGDCCNNPRSFINPNNTWSAITCIRTDNRVKMRRNNIQQFDGTYTLNDFTANSNFGILYNYGGGSHATNRFTELIMYKYDIAQQKINGIELDEISFWSL